MSGLTPPAGLEAHLLDTASPLPLVLEYPRDRRVAALADVIAGNRPYVESALREHGALLFRGSDAHEPGDVERVARALSDELKNDYLGTSPRNALTEHVFNASELPPFYPIPQHLEMSFVKEPPSRILFSCLVAPAAPGGETPLCDFRAVYRDLDPGVRARFLERGVRNVRNYSGPTSKRLASPWQLKPWHELFGTTDRGRVEEICREQDFQLEWLPGGRLRLVNVQPAARPHPVSKEPVWFNHAQVFHLSQAEGEYRRIARRQDRLRMVALALVARSLSLVQRSLLDEDELAMHCTYGDGSPIPLSDMEAVRDAIWKNLRTFRWQRGDVVWLDNRAISHGRMPYRGPRRVVVAWA
jgi:alpha-ketoglutarate-dependent taurine dioxygenase